jgi:hypothetical protein
MLAKTRYANWWAVMGLVAGLAIGCAVPAWAQQVSAPFKVTVSLQPSTDQGVYCSTTHGAKSFGATVTVVCSTGAQVALAAPAKGGLPWTPMHGGAYQYASYLSRAGEGYGHFDAFTTTGTITTWRQVQLHDRSYTELMVSW